MSEVQGTVQDQQTTAIVKPEIADAGNAMLVNQFDPSKGRVGFWCSRVPSSARDKAAVYNAMNGRVQPLEEVMNTEICVTDVLLQGVSISNPATGEITECVRCVLFAEDGKMYACVSTGIHESIKKAIAVLGMPSWNPGVYFIPRKQKAKTGSFFFLELIDKPHEPETQQPAKPAGPPKTEPGKNK